MLFADMCEHLLGHLCWWLICVVAFCLYVWIDCRCKKHNFSIKLCISHIIGNAQIMESLEKEREQARRDKAEKEITEEHVSSDEPPPDEPPDQPPPQQPSQPLVRKIHQHKGQPLLRARLIPGIDKTDTYKVICEQMANDACVDDATKLEQTLTKIGIQTDKKDAIVWLTNQGCRVDNDRQLARDIESRQGTVGDFFIELLKKHRKIDMSSKDLENIYAALQAVGAIYRGNTTWLSRKLVLSTGTD